MTRLPIYLDQPLPPRGSRRHDLAKRLREHAAHDGDEWDTGDLLRWSNDARVLMSEAVTTIDRLTRERDQLLALRDERLKDGVS